MGFAIKQNVCPACGTTLMDNNFQSEIKRIKMKIQESKIIAKYNFADGDIDVLSIFIKNSFLKDNESDVIETAEEDRAEETLEDIRAQVRDEVLGESLHQVEDSEGDFDSDIERKKYLAKNNPFKKKTGARVSRISG